MHTTRTYLAQFLVLSLALTVALGANYLYAAWGGPLSSPPPNCISGNPGCDPPINTSATAQTKAGDLTSAGLQADVLSVLGNTSIVGKLRIGASGAPAQLLDLQGTVGTDGIRFPDGTVQYTAGGGGESTINSLINSVGILLYVSNLVTEPQYWLNFGTDWSLILLIGYLNVSDDTSAGGIIRKKADGSIKANLYVGSQPKSFTVTYALGGDGNPIQYCAEYSGTNYLCVRLDAADNLQVRITNDKLALEYIEFK